MEALKRIPVPKEKPDRALGRLKRAYYADPERLVLTSAVSVHPLLAANAPPPITRLIAAEYGRSFNQVQSQPQLCGFGSAATSNETRTASSRIGKSVPPVQTIAPPGVEFSSASVTVTTSHNIGACRAATCAQTPHADWMRLRMPGVSSAPLSE